MVDICFILLALGEHFQREKDPALRKNPVHVCRAVAAMVRRAESSSDPSRGTFSTPGQAKPLTKEEACSKQHLLPISSLS